MKKVADFRLHKASVSQFGGVWNIKMYKLYILLLEEGSYSEGLVYFGPKIKLAEKMLFKNPNSGKY